MTIGIRPYDIVLCEESADALGPFTVEIVEPLGTKPSCTAVPVLLSCRLHRSRNAAKVGDTVFLRLDLDGFIFSTVRVESGCDADCDVVLMCPAALAGGAKSRRTPRGALACL